jgi:predicted transposase YbfD/YdcC
MLVSFFSHQQGFVYASQVMENKQISEQQVVQQMLMTLQLQGAVVTADALHCQKKPWRVCSNKVSTMLCV